MLRVGQSHLLMSRRWWKGEAGAEHVDSEVPASGPQLWHLWGVVVTSALWEGYPDGSPFPHKTSEF